MTDADIIRIAQESELWDAIGSIARVYGTINPAIIDFARRIRAEALEEAAKVCDASAAGTRKDKSAVGFHSTVRIQFCASAIRALAKQ